jgi:hypothetical protein
MDQWSMINDQRSMINDQLCSTSPGRDSMPWRSIANWEPRSGPKQWAIHLSLRIFVRRNFRSRFPLQLCQIRLTGCWFGYHYPPRAWSIAFYLHAKVSATDPSSQNDGPSMVNWITAVPRVPSSVGAVYFVELSKDFSHHSLTRVFMGVEPTESEIVTQYRDAGWVVVLSQYGSQAHLTSTGRRGTRKGEAHCSVRKSYANYRVESCWFSLSRLSFLVSQI